MKQIGIWQVTDDKPKKLGASNVGLEENLEKWIEDDPSLLEEGLEIVGRQLHVEKGVLDLLALNPQGQWVVIELKSGDVRRSAVTQALDYASCIAKLPWEELRQAVEIYLKRRDESLQDFIHEREEIGQESPAARDVIMYVVGTGSYPGLERMVDFLSEVHDVPITSSPMRSSRLMVDTRSSSANSPSPRRRLEGPQNREPSKSFVPGRSRTEFGTSSGRS